MKLLFVNPCYEPAWAFGGVISSTAQLCKALVKYGVDITVFTTDADGNGGHLNVPLNEPVDLDGVKVCYFRCDFGLKEAFYSRNLSKKLKEALGDFDLVHVSAIWQWIQVDVYKACKLFPVPYVVSTKGSISRWSWNQHNLKKRLYWTFWGRKTIKGAASIFFTSEDERLQSFNMFTFLRSIPSIVIPHGIDTKGIRRTKNIKEVMAIGEDRFILLFLGRIHPGKGIHLILEALEKLGDKKFLFLIVGPKEDTHYVKKLAYLSNKIKNMVIWHDIVPIDEIWNFYYSSNLLVLPSYHENFSMVTIEALACGLPVLISKDVGIWREIESNNAGFVVDHDVDEIARILKISSEDCKLLEQMSYNAKKLAEDKYEISKISTIIIKYFEDILTGKRGSQLQ